MRKRGISPLISWVLLFGFAIAMAALIFGWASDRAREQEFNRGQEIYCNEAVLSVKDCVRDASGISVGVTFVNKGKWTLHRIGAHIESLDTVGDDGIPLSSCIYFLNGPDTLEPGEEDSWNFRISDSDNKIYLDIDGVTCKSNTPAGAVVIFIKTLEFVPHIQPPGEDQPFACPDSKVVVDNPNDVCVT
jgi:hypothetical protein